jgi:hypothetical protein
MQSGGASVWRRASVQYASARTFARGRALVEHANRTLLCGLVVLVTGATIAGPAKAVIAAEIERETDALSRYSGGSASGADVEALRQAIAKGQAASADLRKQIADLESQKAELQKQQSDLERVQIVLASGLIGALATAAVAVFGVVSKWGDSKAERELKQLEVLEKAYELDAKGVALPEKLRLEIGLSARPNAGT